MNNVLCSEGIVIYQDISVAYSQITSQSKIFVSVVNRLIGSESELLEWHNDSVVTCRNIFELVKILSIDVCQETWQNITRHPYRHILTFISNRFKNISICLWTVYFRLHSISWLIMSKCQWSEYFMYFTYLPLAPRFVLIYIKKTSSYYLMQFLKHIHISHSHLKTKLF